MTNETPRSALRAKFYAHIGECITSWAWIESALFELCHCAIECTRQRAAVIFGRTPTLETRIALTDELLRCRFPKQGKKNGGHDHEIIKEWNSIKRSVLKLMSTRNAISHRPLTEVISGLFDAKIIFEKLAGLEVGEGLTFFSSSEPGSEMVVHAHTRDRLRNPEADIAGIKSEDLDSHLREVREAGANLHALVKKARTAGRRSRIKKQTKKTK